MHPDAVPEISAAAAAALLGAGAVLVDVREDAEWSAVHAPDAVHAPMSAFAQHTDRLPTDRRLVCICHVGARSAIVAAALRRGGWDAVNLAGGMDAWIAAGLPVVTGDASGLAGPQP
jgi:rhodanese-related sulfurtransferase